ncbi:phytanoyl-CoA dioxygenase family protein [Cognaticolwellia beringensis]|uniref:Phytanoyl-CoA dioxygenase n=1 Tax=Cognaticolwellia beringensis TaxID=1967665 RepID=A0A222GDJ1_9GAMM|nr:phytanoyl-CoA dioxygenase family protein [Cognaticolwellia beringensis]ASP49762.1 phytanoyl-CoA dioxygenase [Cognaticolwellia beringensis]
MSARKQYDDMGYVVIRDFLSDIEILAISKHVNSIFESWMCSNKTEIFEHKLVNMHSLTQQVFFEDTPEKRVDFFNSISPVKLTNLLESMFGSEIYFHNTQLFFNPLNSKRLPYWHRDMQYSPISDDIQKAEQKNMVSLHIRIPLVKEKGVEIIPGTHKRWDTDLERDVRFELNGHQNNEELPNAILIELDVGDILIFSSQMIHRGNYELNDSRKALDLCVGQYHHLSFNFFDKQVLPTEKEIELIKNNQWYSCANKLFKRDK